MIENEEIEVRDIDQDIELRKGLIEEVKAIDENADWNTIARQLTELQRKWKRIYYWESAIEDELSEEFDQLIHTFYVKRNEGFQNNSELKHALIERAKHTAHSKEWNKATQEMNELMTEWKTVGTCGKEKDDELWEQFNAARQTFFDRKHQNWEDMQTKYEHAHTVKKELIEKANALCESTEWQATSNSFKEMMDQWKAVGNAGKEVEEELWNAFRDARQKFYDRRNEYYDALHEKQEQFYQAKHALVEQAQEIVATKDFSKENTEKMKNLGNEWKAIGNCGKEKEDEIWSTFRATMDQYFDGLKQWNEQRHQDWVQRMHDVRQRKLDMIANQKRTIQRLQNSMVGLLSQREIDDVTEEIEDRKDFILELEEEIADIEKKLA